MVPRPMLVASPISFAPLTPCSAAATLWQRRGQLGVTVVVKASFDMVDGSAAKLATPSPLALRETHFDKAPQHSIEAASDLAPALREAGVVLTGHAYAPGDDPVGAMSVRLVIARDRPLVDKTVHVYGNRAGREAPQPFSFMPLRYERALGGDAQPDNPVGRSAVVDAAPNLLHGGDPSAAGAFGPIASYWPARRRPLGDHDPRRLAARIPDFAETFDWDHFQAAPPDQRLPFLAGDEWIVLSGMSPHAAILRTRLPMARAEARAVLLTASGGSRHELLSLVADTLILQPDIGRLSVVWRGHRGLAIGEEDLPRLGVLAGVATEDAPLTWPADQSLGPLEEKLKAAVAASTLSPSDDARPIFSDLVLIEGLASPAAAADAAAPTIDPVTTPAPPALADAPETAPGIEPQADAPDVPLEPVPPPRASDDVPLVTDAPYAHTTVAWQLEPPQDALVVVLKATYDLAANGTLSPRELADFCRGDGHVGDDTTASCIYPSDVALRKSLTDVVLVGHAHAPSEGATAGRVRFRFGHEGNAFDRQILVTGDRTWKRSIAGASAGKAEPFEAIPLVYERAFGGPDHEPNPVGRGRGDDERMPNLELVGRAVTSPNDKLPPACFAPIATLWEGRWPNRGTYDDHWFKTRWPYYPDDFDWAHFQAAPAEQRLTLLRGDEPFVLEGMHPDAESIEGQLPGQRARAFVVGRKPEHPDHFREVPVVLDTVVFDLDAMTVNLVWRGNVAVSADDAPEVQTLFALRESLDAPATPLDEARDAYLRAITPEAPPPPPPVAPPPPPSTPPPPDPLDAIDRQLDANQAELHAALEKAGLDGDALAPPPPPAPEDVAEMLRDAGATPGEVEEVLEALAPPEDDEEEETPPEPPLRERVITMLNEGASFDGFDFEGDDLSDLDFSSRSLVGANMQRASFRRCRFDGAILVDAQLGETDCTGASFAAANMAGVDATESRLDSANFEGAHLEDAQLVHVTGTAARFDGAHAEGAFLESSNWTDASFRNATLRSGELNHCNLTRVSFEGANASNVGFRKAHGEGVVFDGATLEASVFADAKLAGASFAGVAAKGAVFERAELDEANFQRATLDEASFLRALARKARFAQATLKTANAMRANFAGTDFRRADFFDAILQSADLHLADFSGASLHGTNLWKAKLQDAKLEGAITTKSTLAARNR